MDSRTTAPSPVKRTSRPSLNACAAQENGARGPIAQQRLSLDGDGLVVLELKRAFSDGTTHVLFESQDFIARLAALVPRQLAQAMTG
jgi:hypothetical protein